MTFQEISWALKRLLFHLYVGFCLLSVIGGFLTAPLFTYLFFGNWQFWKYFNPGWKLLFQGWGFLIRMLRWENNGFMFSVPLTSPPISTPDLKLVAIQSNWEHGSSCGDCNHCCTRVYCPILDKETGLCRGYDSFFWRYFNCGRFPTVQSEIDYYGCPKWKIITSSASNNKK